MVLETLQKGDGADFGCVAETLPRYSQVLLPCLPIDLDEVAAVTAAAVVHDDADDADADTELDYFLDLPKRP